MIHYWNYLKEYNIEKKKMLINNNMVDDVKVILAEYRMALKKNNIYKGKL